VIEQLDGEPLRSMADLIDALERYQVGDRVRLQVFRDGRRIDVPVGLGGQAVQID
jgi:S1-C subfamily serine protease